MIIRISLSAILLSLFSLAAVGCGASTESTRLSLATQTPAMNPTTVPTVNVGIPVATTLAPTAIPVAPLATATAFSPNATSAPTARPRTATPTEEPPHLLFSSSSKPPLEWAELLVKQVQLSKTAYQHQVTVVTWAGVDGATEFSSYADCSGFMNALFAQADDISAEEFKDWLGSRRPYAKDYYAAITSARGFTPIDNVAAVKPGDIIAIRYPNSAPGDNTGHLLLVSAAPQPRAPSKPVVNATQQWDVTIIDSSESGHGTADTRRLTNGSFHDGVGKGTFRLYADNSGALVGYSWSDLSDSIYYDQTTRPLAIGRLNPKFSLP